MGSYLLSSSRCSLVGLLTSVLSPLFWAYLRLCCHCCSGPTYVCVVTVVLGLLSSVLSLLFWAYLLLCCQCCSGPTYFCVVSVAVLGLLTSVLSVLRFWAYLLLCCQCCGSGPTYFCVVSVVLGLLTSVLSVLFWAYLLLCCHCCSWPFYARLGLINSLTGSALYNSPLLLSVIRTESVKRTKSIQPNLFALRPQ